MKFATTCVECAAVWSVEMDRFPSKLYCPGCGRVDLPGDVVEKPKAVPMTVSDRRVPRVAGKGGAK